MRILRLRDMKGLWADAAVRGIYFAVFLVLERWPPFKRVIQPEELWMYKYPHQASYFPVTVLWPLVLLTPTFIIVLFFWLRRDAKDALHAVLAVTLALTLNGMITNTIKVIVGRPRPDFYNRCFPDGQGNDELLCTGPTWLVNDGRKSFPSGHSSFYRPSRSSSNLASRSVQTDMRDQASTVAFAGFGFVSLYVAGKLRAGSASDGQAWRISAALAPLLFALCIALSRTCDYHHHWQDVVVGSILGLSVTVLSYRLYFPWPGTSHGQRPHELHNVASCPALILHDTNVASVEQEIEDEDVSLLQPRGEIKWI